MPDPTRTVNSVHLTDIRCASVRCLFSCRPWQVHLRHAEEVLRGGRLQALILRVLGVDDSEVVRRGICQILQSESDTETVCEAADGADAVRWWDGCGLQN